jgi:hypothetical protein
MVLDMNITSYLTDTDATKPYDFNSREEGLAFLEAHPDLLVFQTVYGVPVPDGGPDVNGNVFFGCRDANGFILDRVSVYVVTRTDPNGKIVAGFRYGPNGWEGTSGPLA